MVPAYHTGTLTTAYLHSIKGRINSEKLEKFTGGLGGLTETFFRYNSPPSLNHLPVISDHRLGVSMPRCRSTPPIYTEGASPVVPRIHYLHNFSLPPDVHGEKHHTYSNVQRIDVTDVTYLLTLFLN